MESSKTDKIRCEDHVLQILGSVASSHDDSTGQHINRTQHYVQALVRVLSHNPRYADFLGDSRVIELIALSAPIHDIGKIGIAHSILHKPGRLDANEFAIIKTHPVLGKRIIDQTAGDLKGDTSFLRLASEMAFSHHEKWDGSGYPLGLSGSQIPQSARVMALADVYDALISKRIYKTPISHNDVKGMIVAGCGTHFDPDVVEAFLQVEEEFFAISENLLRHSPAA